MFLAFFADIVQWIQTRQNGIHVASQGPNVNFLIQGSVVVLFGTSLLQRGNKNRARTNKHKISYIQLTQYPPQNDTTTHISTAMTLLVCAIFPIFLVKEWKLGPIKIVYFDHGLVGIEEILRQLDVIVDYQPMFKTMQDSNGFCHIQGNNKLLGGCKLILWFQFVFIVQLFWIHVATTLDNPLFHVIMMKIFGEDTQCTKSVNVKRARAGRSSLCDNGIHANEFKIVHFGFRTVVVPGMRHKRQKRIRS
jgi:hypothetical protein